MDQLSRGLTLSSNQALDALVAPIADLITDPADCWPEVSRIIERLGFLAAGGHTRQGRLEFMLRLGQVAMTEVLGELRRESDKGEPDWQRVGRLTGMSADEARETFSSNRYWAPRTGEKDRDR